MFSRRFWVLLALSTGLAHLSLPGRAEEPSPARTLADVYLDHSLGVLDQIKAHLPILTRVADVVADRLVAGGKLYIGGSQKAFDTEGYYRAGGLMLLQYYQEDADLGPQDTVLLGSAGGPLETDVTLVQSLRRKQVMTVVFGSPGDFQLWQQADYFLYNFAVTTDGLLRWQNKSICPIAPVMNVASLWAFTAELVAALTRRQVMPTMFQSVMVPGARERNAKYLPTPFHTDLKVDPVAPGVLGRQYLAALRQEITGLQKTQRNALRAAGEKVAQARAAGHTAYAVLVGHYPPAEIGRPGDPGLFRPAEAKGQPEEPLAGIQAGDVVFYVGYTWLPEPLLRGAKEAGATTICAIARGEGWEVSPDLVDVFIDPQWRLGDAAVEVPGYDVRILPPSGVIQPILYWCVVAEAAGWEK